jgi:membrane protein YqaA with SNARE-associated domain
MNREKLIKFLRSKNFKKITLVLGVIFLVLTGLISFKPEPFLQFGYLGVFIFSLFGAGTFLVFSLSRYMNIFGLAGAIALGTALNDSVAWLIGNSGESIVPRSSKTQGIEKSVQKYGVFALFVWSLLPVPYDIIGLIAGYLGISYKRYVIPTFLGKFVRMILIGGGIISYFGAA